jgi:pimeloyl-ACP methyl ester carboxylesterase
VSFLTTPDGVRLRISDRGAGSSTLLLVHGWKQSHRLWDETIAALAERHRVVAFDLRGMGESDKPRARYDFDEYADDLGAVISALDLDDVTLVGWSMGCTVSLQYLSRGRGRVGRLVLINGPIRLTATEGFAHAMPEALVDGVLDDLAEHWPTRERSFVAASIHAPHPDQVEWLFRIALQTPLDVALRAVREQIKLDHRDVVGALPVPVLAAYGRHDPYYPPALAEWIAANAPVGEHVIFEHSAHCIPFEEGRRFRAELESFIARHPARRRV